MERMNPSRARPPRPASPATARSSPAKPLAEPPAATAAASTAGRHAQGRQAIGIHQRHERPRRGPRACRRRAAGPPPSPAAPPPCRGSSGMRTRSPNHHRTAPSTAQPRQIQTASACKAEDRRPGSPSTTAAATTKCRSSAQEVPSPSSTIHGQGGVHDGHGHRERAHPHVVVVVQERVEGREEQRGVEHQPHQVFDARTPSPHQVGRQRCRPGTGANTPT